MTRVPSVTKACSHYAQATPCRERLGLVAKPGDPASSNTTWLTTSRPSALEETASSQRDDPDQGRGRGTHPSLVVLRSHLQQSTPGAGSRVPYACLWVAGVCPELQGVCVEWEPLALGFLDQALFQFWRQMQCKSHMSSPRELPITSDDILLHCILESRITPTFPLSRLGEAEQSLSGLPPCRSVPLVMACLSTQPAPSWRPFTQATIPGDLSKLPPVGGLQSAQGKLSMPSARA
jgi:hypothetical protein